MTTLPSVALLCILITQLTPTLIYPTFVTRGDQATRRKASDDLLRQSTEVEMEFVGLEHVPWQELLGVMKWARDPGLSSRPLLRPGTALEDFEDDLERVRFFLGSRGYLQAKIGEPQIEGVGGRVKLIIPIEEGTRYRCGVIEVRGATAFGPEGIIRLSGLKPGEVASAATIQEGLYGKVKEAYGELGFFHAAVDLEPDFIPPDSGAGDGTVNFTIEIEEGEVFRIGSIEFGGDLKENDRLARRQLLIREGEIYNRRLINESLARLNQLNVYEEILPKDVITRSDEKRQEINLFIRARKRE